MHLSALRSGIRINRIAAVGPRDGNTEHGAGSAAVDWRAASSRLENLPDLLRMPGLAGAAAAAVICILLRKHFGRRTGHRLSVHHLHFDVDDAQAFNVRPARRCRRVAGGGLTADCGFW